MKIKTENNKSTHVRKTFLYDMVAADIWRYRNIERDSTALSIAKTLEEQTGRSDGNVFYFYALRLAYTDALHFEWHPDTPIDFTSLEEWWNMVESGKPPAECYDFWIKNISNPVSNKWHDALESAQTIWKPPEEKTGEESDDPN